MGRISGTGSPKAPARSWPNLDIETDTGRLGPDRVFIRETSIGYVCAGLGDPARLLRFAFERPSATEASGKSENYETNPIFAAACDRLDKALVAGGVAKARRLGLEIPLGALDDPALRRLAIAAALIRSGFDPDQPRDDGGRWTSGGGGSAASNSDTGAERAGASASLTTGLSAPVAAAGAVAVMDMATASMATASVSTAAFGEAAATSAGTLSSAGPALGEAATMGAGWSLWSEGALSLLPRIAGLAGPIGIVGGLVFAPANHSGEFESSGTLPDHPDISYFSSETRLQLYRTGPDGEHTLLYDNYPGADGYYRDADGHVIGKSLGFKEGFVLDPAAISTLSPPTMDARAREKDPAEVAGREAALAGAKAVVRAIDQTQVCPDPTFDVPHGASMRARLYQEQVTGVPWGVAFDIGGTKFDGCRYWSDGTMLEAKGEGYAWAMTPNGWRRGYKGGPKMEAQMADQSAKAWVAGKRVEWHFAEKSVADYFKVYAQRFGNVDVVDDPPLRKPANQKIHLWEPSEMLLASAGEFVRFDLFEYLKGVRAAFLGGPEWTGTGRSTEAGG